MNMAIGNKNNALMKGDRFTMKKQSQPLPLAIMFMLLVPGMANADDIDPKTEALITELCSPPSHANGERSYKKARLNCKLHILRAADKGLSSDKIRDMHQFLEDASIQKCGPKPGKESSEAQRIAHLDCARKAKDGARNTYRMKEKMKKMKEKHKQQREAR
jgi:DNA-binding transcriptional MerR regulator